MLTTREELFARLDAEGAAWLDSALAQARDAGRTRTEAPPGSGVPRWELLFSTAGRRCGPSPVVEAARVLMLHAARPDADAVTRLYERGTGAERRAVLLALPCLPLPPEAGVRLVEDALRTNDGRLVAAAVGPYAAAHLDAHAWRHAVLKCLFTGVPVAVVAGLADRAGGDVELARMLRDFARERAAAGRPVPDDLSHVLALTAQGA